MSKNRRELLSSRRFGWLALLAFGLAAPAPAEEPAPAAVDLLGTWHVLVHYTDANSNDPEQLRWDDRIWSFERTGSRLRWDEAPIVVFGDSSGRFEHLGTNRARRITGAWEPNEKQFVQIQEGLEVNDRGKKSKKLQQVEGVGWSSQSSSPSTSASVLSYVEHWSIQGTPERPIFRREDQLGPERSSDLDGVTLYSTTWVDPSGALLRGRFERDGTREGTFRMLRAAPVSGVRGSGKTQSERFRDIQPANTLVQAQIIGDEYRLGWMLKQS